MLFFPLSLQHVRALLGCNTLPSGLVPRMIQPNNRSIVSTLELWEMTLSKRADGSGCDIM